MLSVRAKGRKGRVKIIGTGRMDSGGTRGNRFFERRKRRGSKKGAVVTTSSNFYCQNVAEKESVREQRGGVGGQRKLLAVKASQVFRARHSIVFPPLRRRAPNKPSSHLWPVVEGRMPSDNEYKTMRNTG